MDNTKVFYVWVFGASGMVSSYLLQLFHYYDGDLAAAGPASSRRGSPKTRQRVYLARTLAVLVYGSLIMSGTFWCVSVCEPCHRVFVCLFVCLFVWARSLYRPALLVQ